MKNNFLLILCFFYSVFTNGQTFNELNSSYENCEDEVSIIETVSSGQTDNKSAKNIIYASNSIENLATANYDAGKAVYLKTGFHAKSNANFRAFIKGCDDNPLSILENTLDIIKIYPNPTLGTLKISSANKIIVSYSIYNSLNKTLFKYQNIKNEEIINIKNLPNGFYFLKIILESGEIITKRIIKI